MSDHIKLKSTRGFIPGKIIVIDSDNKNREYGMVEKCEKCSDEPYSLYDLTVMKVAYCTNIKNRKLFYQVMKRCFNSVYGLTSANNRITKKETKEKI